MRNPWFIKASLAVSESIMSPGDIPLVKARTVGITASVAYPAAADVDATVYLYYSPDGSSWDTIAFTSFDLTRTASATVQRTVILDIPEHGYLKAKVTNGSAAKTLTNIKVWYSVQSWEEDHGISRGDIRKDTGED